MQLALGGMLKACKLVLQACCALCLHGSSSLRCWL